MLRNISALGVRNTKIFLRDKATFFFSIMSMLILIMLYFLFIANIYIDGINENVVELSKKTSSYIVYLQMMAGVLVLNSMSLSLGMFSGVAKDMETQKMNSFLTTPITRLQILVSYYAGGVVVSFALNLITWIVTILLIGVLTGFWVFASTFFYVIAVLLMSSLVSSSIMMLLTAVSRSSTALGVINGVAGTFLGFVCGIYMPYTNLGKGVEAVGSFLPFTHLTIWLKNIVLTDAFSQAGIEGEMKDTLMNEWFTAEGVGFCGLDVPLAVMLLVSVAVAAVCLAAAGLFLKKRLNNKGD